jgi:hypothetical protein
MCSMFDSQQNDSYLRVKNFFSLLVYRSWGQGWLMESCDGRNCSISFENKFPWSGKPRDLVASYDWEIKFWVRTLNDEEES